MGATQSVLGKDKKQKEVISQASAANSKNDEEKNIANHKSEKITNWNESAMLSWLYSNQAGIFLDEILYPIVETLLSNEQIKFAIAETYLGYLMEEKSKLEEKIPELKQKNMAGYFLAKEQVEWEQEKIDQLNEKMHAWDNVDLLSLMVNLGERDVGFGDFACRACEYFRLEYFSSAAISFLDKYKTHESNIGPEKDGLLNTICNLPNEQFTEIKSFNKHANDLTKAEKKAFFDICLLYSLLKIMNAYKSLKQRRIQNETRLFQTQTEVITIKRKNSNNKNNLFSGLNLDLSYAANRSSNQPITPRASRVEELKTESTFFGSSSSPRNSLQSPRLTPRIEQFSLEEVQKKIQNLLDASLNFQNESYSEPNKLQDDYLNAQVIIPSVQVIGLTLHFIARLSCVIENKDSQLGKSLLSMQPVFTSMLVLWKQTSANFQLDNDLSAPRLQ